MLLKCELFSVLCKINHCFRNVGNKIKDFLQFIKLFLSHVILQILFQITNKFNYPNF